MTDRDPRVLHLVWGPVAVLAPAERVLRLGLLHEATTFTRIEAAAIARLRERLRHCLRTAWGGPAPAHDLAVLAEVVRGERPELPARLAHPFASALGVSAGYFTDAAVARRDEAALLPLLLTQAGVDGGWLCRVQPSWPQRAPLCVALLETARRHAEGNP